VLKEGLYEDREQRETLLSLARFRSTARDGLISLDDYVAAMRPGRRRSTRSPATISTC